jgi:hypothetical protein
METPVPNERSLVMRLRKCRECEHYIMDDGHEVSCHFAVDVAYYEIKIAHGGADVLRCPVDINGITVVNKKGKKAV